MGGVGFTIDPFRDESKYLLMGVAGSIAFVLGFTAGILTLRRAVFPMVILGLVAVIFAPYFTLFENELFLILGLSPLILGVTALAFVALSHREFRRGSGL
ncbi:MAG: hypothetical protein MUE55_05300 [Thermoplasmata archaeon]|nr:hypothetical protein [Thermoplasmata archaeon]